jgi:hypothetical protein
MTTTTTSVCATCATPLPRRSKARGGKPQSYCSPRCRKTAENRRAGHAPRATLTIRPSNSLKAASDAPTQRSVADEGRVTLLLDKAHSRTGISSFEIAELAKLRGIDPSAPLKVIFARTLSAVEARAYGSLIA